MNESSRPRDFHLVLDRTHPASLRRQLANEIRDACRNGRLLAGMALPSSRELAVQLGVSRGVVTDAYNQLAAEGYIEQLPRRAPLVLPTSIDGPTADDPLPQPATWRYDLAATAPDLARFPRREWAAALRDTLRTLPDKALDYGDPRGPEVFRKAICDHLTRARGCHVDPTRTVAVAGFTEGFYVACAALRRQGATAVAVEDPCLDEQLPMIRMAGLRPVPIPVDADGIRVDLLREVNVQAAVVTPAHQFPTGAVLSPTRRQDLINWANENGTYIVEDDYDAEYRYDREPVGTIQGRAPQRVIYIGTTSKTLAPVLRIGWVHVPDDLLLDICDEHWYLGGGPPTIDLHAYAHLLEKGDVDRHLRRTRTLYQARRKLLIESLHRELPDLEIRGISAGLHLTLDLPENVDATAVADTLASRRVNIRTIASHTMESRNATSGLMIGYGQLQEPQIRAAVRLIASAIDEHRPSEPSAPTAPAKH